MKDFAETTPVLLVVLLTAVPKQCCEQRLQSVVVNLAHQCEESADLSGRKALTCKPVQVVARQISDQAALVLAEGHLVCDELLEVFRIHDGIVAQPSLWGFMPLAVLYQHTDRQSTDYEVLAGALSGNANRILEDR